MFADCSAEMLDSRDFFSMYIVKGWELEETLCTYTLPESALRCFEICTKISTIHTSYTFVSVLHLRKMEKKSYTSAVRNRT